MQSLKEQLRCDSILGMSVWDLSQNLISVSSEAFPDIGYLLFNKLNKEWGDLFKEIVAHVVIPSRAEDSIVGLQNEVVTDVVYDDGLWHVSAQQTQVFYQEGPVLRGVLTVEPILDVLVHIYLIDDLVGVVLESCCEDHYLVKLGHQLDEVHTAWTN